MWICPTLEISRYSCCLSQLQVPVWLTAPCCFHREAAAAAHCWQAEMKFGTLQGLKNPIDSGAQTV